MVISPFLSDKPGPVCDLQVPEVTPTSAKVTWTPPKDNGGTDITGYVVEKRDASRQTWTNIATTKELECTADKLVEKNKYIVRVSAVNEVGQGEPVETQPIQAKYTFGKFNNVIEVLYSSSSLRVTHSHIRILYFNMFPFISFVQINQALQMHQRSPKSSRHPVK